MKKVFCFIGALLYASFMAFILSMGFGYLTVWFMQFGWLAAIIYFFAATFGYQLINAVCMIAYVPLFYLVERCNVAKWFAILPIIGYGYIAITLPWKLPFDYSFVNYFMAFEVSSLAFATYFTMTTATINIKKKSEYYNEF